MPAIPCRNSRSIAAVCRSVILDGRDRAARAGGGEDRPSPAGFVAGRGRRHRHFADAPQGGPGTTVARRRARSAPTASTPPAAGVFYPNEGAPQWNGVHDVARRGGLAGRGATARPWRSAAAWAASSCSIPIAPPEADGRQLMNWVVNISTDGRRPSRRRRRRAGRAPRHAGAGAAPRRRFTVPGYRHRGAGARHRRDLRIPDVRPRSAAALDLRPGDAARRCGASDVSGRLERRLARRSSTPAPRRQPRACRARPRRRSGDYEQDAAAEDRRDRPAQPQGRPGAGDRRGREPAHRPASPTSTTCSAMPSASAIVRGYAVAAGFARVTRD